MTEDERLDLLDLLPEDAPIWADDEELPTFGARATLSWWLDTVGHPKAHPACCKTCGCATTCMAGAFYDAVVMTTIRELDKIGALVKPAPAPSPVSAPEGDR